MIELWQGTDEIVVVKFRTDLGALMKHSESEAQLSPVFFLP